MRTEQLIDSLTATAPPVRRLRSPMVRLILWLAVSAPWVAAIVVMMGLRPDIAVKFGDLRWLTEQAAALLTGLLAATAACCAGVPGRPRWEHALPLLPLGVWLGSLSAGCLQTWLTFGPAGMALAPDWLCIPGIALVGLVPAVAMVVMLRHGAPVAPVASVALGALAAAALADFGLRLFHPQDASFMVLVWQFGTVLALAALGAATSRRLVRWRHAG